MRGVSTGVRKFGCWVFMSLSKTWAQAGCIAALGVAVGLAHTAFASWQPPLAISAGPSTGLIDVGLPVFVRGAAPGARVVIRASLLDDHNLTWTSEATFDADAEGAVDVAQTASVAGTYTGVSAHSLLCSMLPVPRADIRSYVESLPTSSNPTTAPALEEGRSFLITINATSQGASTELKVTRGFKAPNVTERDVNEGRLRGHFFQLAHEAIAKPAVLVIGGSGGGLTESPAMLFASHGYPAFALGYFNYADLPKGLVNIPIELFAEAATWLKHATGGAPIVMWGVSRGSEAVMLTAAHFPDLLSGVIAVAPAPVPDGPFGPGAGVSDFAWTLHGKGIPFGHLAPDDEKRFDKVWATAGKTPPGAEGTPYYLDLWNDPSAVQTLGIPVENITSPVLLLAGASDTMWPSWLGAQLIRDRMALHGIGASVEVHTYPGAGHSISRLGVGNEISSFGFHRVAKEFVSFGGLGVSNCEASFDAWHQQLRFLSNLVSRSSKSDTPHN